MTALPKRKPNRHVDVDVRAFSAAPGMTTSQLLQLGGIAEDRGDHRASSWWKAQAAARSQDQMIQKTVDQFNGKVPAQPPAPVRTVDRSTEFVNDRTARSVPEASPQGRRNQELLDRQLRSMQ